MLKVENHKIQDPAEYSKHLASKKVSVFFPASFSWSLLDQWYT